MHPSLLRLWLVVAGAAAGAAVGSTGRFEPLHALGLVLTAGILMAMRRVPSLALVALLMGGFGAAAASASIRTAQGNELEALASSVPRCVVTGRVLERVGALGTFVAVDEATCAAGAGVGAGGVAVADLDAAAGSGITATGWLLPLSREGFGAARRRGGARAELRAEDTEITPPTGVFSVASRVRAALAAATEAVAPEEGGLLRGVTIGDTDGISAQRLEQFRRSGLSHLVAVSGSNVAIVLAGVAWAAARMSLYGRVAMCAGALALFVLVVGPDGSVLRAAAMGAIGLVALVVGRQAEPLHALGTALVVLMAIRPSSVFSLGLHLSVAATGGIILWASRLNRRMDYLPQVVSLPLSVTLAAQLGVLPLLAMVFGEVSVVAPASNLAAAPAVAPATVIGFVGGLVGIVHEGLGGIILRAAEPFASWILLVAEVSARPAWAAVSVPKGVAWSSAAATIAACAAALRRVGEPITLRG